MALLDQRTIRLNARYTDKAQAIRDVGRLLVEAGKVAPEYVEKMIAREALATTYVGNGVAVPHGTKDSLAFVKSTGLAVVQVPDGVDFGNGNRARLLVGIAAQGDEHLDLLTTIAEVCSDDDRLERLIHAPDAAAVLAELAIGGA
ncbi:MAG TPA: PTS sugar transporter subunit IIA [Spirochaetia bacterium]|nr:PTS sugar transporter subunit IIA [Spirochaetia bacterium]